MRLHSLKSPHSGAAPLETGVCRCVHPTVVSNHTGAHAGVFVWFGVGTASCLCARLSPVQLMRIPAERPSSSLMFFRLFSASSTVLPATNTNQTLSVVCRGAQLRACVCVQRCGPTLENPWRPPLSVLPWCPGWGQRNWGGSPGGCPEWERTGNSGAPLVALLREKKPILKCGFNRFFASIIL